MRFADYDLALVLSGGAALGAYQAGAYEALHEAGLLPRHIAGTSIGAFNAVLIAGNRPEDRVGRLRRFWDAVAEPVDGSAYALEHGPVRRTNARLAGLRTRLLGRSGFCAPQLLAALAPVPTWRSPGLYDLGPALETLRRLASFPEPDDGEVRLTLHATDLATGEAVRLDSRERQLAPDHVRASASLLPDYPPTEVDGRLLCDGGFSENLPLRSVFEPPPERPLLCIAVDLIPAASEPRWSLDGMAERQQDLQFASQTQLLIDAIESRLALAGERSGGSPSVVLAHLVHCGHEDGGSQKTYDFSRRAIATRWRRGRDDGRAMVAALDAAPLPAGAGLNVWRFPGGSATAAPARAAA